VFRLSWKTGPGDSTAETPFDVAAQDRLRTRSKELLVEKVSDLCASAVCLSSGKIRKDLAFHFGFNEKPAHCVDLLHKITKNALLSKSNP
jgi:hypothetical protein